MRCNLFIQALIDGIIGTVGLVGLELLITSKMFAECSLTQLLFVSTAPAVLFSIVYSLFLRNKKSIKEFIYFSSISAIAFVFCMIIHFVISISFPVEIPFQRELCDVDGFFIIFVALLFILSYITLRICVLVYLITKNKRTFKKK